MERRLAAILAADVVGYSRLMGADEAGTLAALKVHRAEANELARQDFVKAIDADPKLPHGHIGLGYVFLNGFRWGWTDLDRDKALELALERAQIAIDLAPKDYFTHRTMAYFLVQAGQLDAALVKFRESLRLNPNSADVRAAMAEALTYAGQVPESIELMQEAMRLDPHHPDWYKWVQGWSKWYVGECEEGLATMARMAHLPNLARRTLASLHVCLGQIEEARAVITEFLKQEPDYSIADVRASLAHKYQNPDDLERWIKDLRVAGLPE